MTDSREEILAAKSRWNTAKKVHVGTRVVIRKQLKPGESSHLLTDVIGTVKQLHPLQVLTRDNTVVTVADSEIQVLKVLMPRVVKNRDIRALEHAAALSWPGTHCEIVDGWLCRAGDVFTRHGSAAVAVFPWANDADLHKIVHWYSENNTPAKLSVVPRLTTGMNAPSPESEISILTIEPSVLAHQALTVSECDIVLRKQPCADWIHFYHHMSDADPHAANAILTPAMNEDGSAGHTIFVYVYAAATHHSSDAAHSPTLAAIGRGAVVNVSDSLTTLSISCISTSSDHRRQGLARLVTATLGQWGQENGADLAFLYCFDDNTAGQKLYESMGFELHHQAGICPLGNQPESTP